MACMSAHALALGPMRACVRMIVCAFLRDYMRVLAFLCVFLLAILSACVLVCLHDGVLECLRLARASAFACVCICVFV